MTFTSTKISKIKHIKANSRKLSSSSAQGAPIRVNSISSSNWDSFSTTPLAMEAFISSMTSTCGRGFFANAASGIPLCSAYSRQARERSSILIDFISGQVFISPARRDACGCSVPAFR